jgi:hypothetical protein
VDLRSGETLRTVPTRSTPIGIIDVSGVLWVTDQLGDALWRVEP